MKVIHELTQLLFPIRCYGCNAIGLSICSLCRREWHPHYYLTHLDKIKVHSAILYSPTASKIILAAKENGLAGADHLIIEAIVHVIKRGDFTSSNARLVPIPSASGNRRRRGRDFMYEICQEISQQTQIPVSPLLTIVRKVSDQSGLSAKDRASNMHGAFALKPGMFPRGDLLLIDDVVTTGASVSEATRALQSGGLRVLGSVTACVTQPLR